jgi:hypothetical protein
MRTLSLVVLIPAVLFAQVSFRSQSDRLRVQIDGQPFTELFHGSSTRKPYLHPLRSASGKLVTRQFPMADVPGERKDHPHHQGLSFTYADVNGYNFWATDSTQQNDKSGSIRLNKIVKTEGGPKSGTARILFYWLTPSGETLLTEDRTMTVRAEPDARVLDFDIIFTARQKAVFGDTKEGMFNIRLASGFDKMTGSNGCGNEKECWGKRADWLDFTGRVNGEDLGVAIFDHPGNLRHPTYWHVREYGLFAANPFGIRDFTADKFADGSLTLQKGEALRFRYRVLIHNGKTEPNRLNALYADYAR